MAEGLNPHHPRKDLEVTDEQMKIGNLKEYGSMKVNHEDFREGRHEKPELKTHLIDPSSPDKDYSKDVGFDPVFNLRKQAEAARILTLIDGAMNLIKDQMPVENKIIESIDTFIKSHHMEKEEEDEDLDDVEKTNIPYSSPPKDSVSELSNKERSGKNN